MRKWRARGRVLGAFGAGNLASHPIPDNERTSNGGRRESSANSSMGQREDDSVLVMRTRRGEREAFALLYDRYSRLVYSVALRVVRNPSTAEDILHDVFLQLWQSPERFDSSRGNLPAWMAVITRNRAIDRIRQQRGSVDPEEVVLYSSCDLGSEVERTTVIERIRELLRTMPEPQCRAVEMAFFEGKTHAEIASEMKEPLGTVKTRIRSALIAIRKVLQP